MRVVLDSNVLFSALISPHSPPHALLEAWREGRFELRVSQHQIDEIRRAGLLQMGNYGRTRIVTPATFCREFLKL